MNIGPQELEAHARKTRKALEKLRLRFSDGSFVHRWFQFEHFPCGCCLEASYLLIHSVHHVLGVDARNAGLCDNGWGKLGSHAWVFVGDYMVDITADQFGAEHPSVIVSGDSHFHREFVGAKSTAMADIHEFQNPDFVEELMQFNRVLASV